MQTKPTAEDEALALARTRFLDSIDAPRDSVPHHIADSWMRSLRAGVDPSGTVTARLEFDLESRLARCAQEPIQQLVRSLGSLDVGVVLADEHARVICRVDSGRSATSLLNAIDLAPGFDYSEDLIGTNGVGSVALTRRPIYVSDAAHFQGRFTGYVCAGAPILHPITGRLEGVLDLTSGFGDSSPLMRTLAVQTAEAIQHRLLEHVSQLEHDALHAFTESVVSAHAHPAALVLADAGQLRLQNPETERMLAPTGIELLVSRAREELGDQDDAVFGLTLPGGTTGSEHVLLRASVSRIAPLGERRHGDGAARPERDGTDGILVRAEPAPRRRASPAVRSGEILTRPGGRDSAMRLDVPEAADGETGAPSTAGNGSGSGSRRGGENGTHAYDVVDQIDFGVQMHSRGWQFVRRDLSASVKAGRTVLVLGEIGTGKVSLIRESARRTRPEAPVVTLAAEQLGHGARLAEELECALRAVQPGDSGGEVVVVLRNAHRLLEPLIPQVRGFLREPRVGGRHAVVALTAETLEHVEGSPLESLLPHISHAVTLPALRHRRADFAAIVSRVMHALEPGSFDRLSSAALQSLGEGHWPGNIHQLTDALRAALAHRPDGMITISDLPEHAFHAALRPLSELEREERNAIITALYRADGNRTAAAERIGVSRATLYRKLASYGLTSA